MKIKVGSRDSVLAQVQARMVIDSIKKYHAAHDVELITMKTTGDIILDRTLDKVGGKGLFVKELDQALLDKRVDLTVHSCKDLPINDNPALPLVAFSKREDPRDVLILPLGENELDPQKPIGCASQRRALQLRGLYPEMKVAPIRGNVQTRLAKLDSGQYSALVLAAAGIKRLRLEARVSRYFEPEEILPSGGQGIVVVQGREGDDASFLAEFHDEEARICALAERGFVAELDGGCSSPVAAFAQIVEGRLFLRGMNAWGVMAEGWGELSTPDLLGRKLASEVKNERY